MMTARDIDEARDRGRRVGKADRYFSLSNSGRPSSSSSSTLSDVIAATR